MRKGFTTMNLSPANRTRLTAFRDAGKSMDDALSYVLDITEGKGYGLGMDSYVDEEKELYEIEQQLEKVKALCRRI